MRCYVLVQPLPPQTGSYILAEVVRDAGDEKEFTPAASLAGARTAICSRTELTRTDDGRRALELWERRDDSAFDVDSAAMAHASRAAGTVLLRAAADEERRDRTRTDLPQDRRHRDVVLRAIGLRETTRAIGARVRARRLELEELRPKRRRVDRP